MPIDGRQITNTLRSNNFLTGMLWKDLSDEDSLLQLPFRGNCLNWTVGHLVHHRGYMLGLLGAEHPWSEGEREPYATGSAPITAADQDGVRSFTQLRADWDAAQQALEDALAAASEEQLAAIVDEERGRSLAEQLAGLAWHETYHVGQMEILRQLAGTDDQVP